MTKDTYKNFYKQLSKIKKNEMLSQAKKIWKFNRSLTGKGNIQTINFLKKINPKLKNKFIKSGSKVYDWIVPQEWHINDAYIEDENGKKYFEFTKNNLHLVGYSHYVNEIMDFKEIENKIHYLKKQPDFIPYVTTYYKKDWGFCCSYNEFKKLDKKKKYKVVINSSFSKGKMNYGELFIRGKTKKEVFFSTNICHPSMANNEISGIILASTLAKILSNIGNLKYSYRFIFIPETIGSISYIKKNFNNLKKNVFAGYVLSCVGDDRDYSIIHSRVGKTLSEKMLKEALKNKKHTVYSYLNRGSDERQYCSPKINLPVCGFSRSKYDTYPEYHTSADDFSVVTDNGLYGSLKVLFEIIVGLELSYKKPMSRYTCEPFMGKRNLYHQTSNKENTDKLKDKNNLFRMNLDILSYCDGKNDVFDISKIIHRDLDIVCKQISLLRELELIK